MQSTLAVLLDRNLAPARIAELTAGYPARRFHLENKGGIAVGNDADLTPGRSDIVVHVRERVSKGIASAPTRAVNFGASSERTMLRGTTIFQEGEFIVNSGGKLLRPKPYATTRIHP